MAKENVSKHVSKGIQAQQMYQKCIKTHPILHVLSDTYKLFFPEGKLREITAIELSEHNTMGHESGPESS